MGYDDIFILAYVWFFTVVGTILFWLLAICVRSSEKESQRTSRRLSDKIIFILFFTFPFLVISATSKSSDLMDGVAKIMLFLNILLCFAFFIRLSFETFGKVDQNDTKSAEIENK